MTVSLPAPPLDSGTFKCTCAEWWSHPAVQLLVGPALRPGGTALTVALLDRVALTSSVRVLDIGSGTGATLDVLTDRGLDAIGLDYSEVLASQAATHAPTTVGDGERLPFAPGSFGALTVECVLSALPDKPALLTEARRVLATDGVLVLSDMTLDGELPEPLDSLLAWVACAAGALPVGGYVELLASAGFEVVVLEDRTDALGAFASKARRRLALLQGAIRVGIIPDPEAMLGPELEQLRAATDANGDGDLTVFGRHVLGQVGDAVRAGQLGYVALVARRT